MASETNGNGGINTLIFAFTVVVIVTILSGIISVLACKEFGTAFMYVGAVSMVVAIPVGTILYNL